MLWLHSIASSFGLKGDEVLLHRMLICCYLKRDHYRPRLQHWAGWERAQTGNIILILIKQHTCKRGNRHRGFSHYILLLTVITSHYCQFSSSLPFLFCIHISVFGREIIRTVHKTCIQAAEDSPSRSMPIVQSPKRPLLATGKTRHRPDF